MKWLKQWIRSVANGPEPEGWDISGAKSIPTPVHNVLRQMANSMATIYRIDNGFIMSINLTNEVNIGQRGACVYAKDASELAEKVIAHETAFKLGVRGSVELSDLNGTPNIYKTAFEHTTPMKGY